MNNMQFFQIDDPDHYVSRLQPEHSDMLQTLFERCADYNLIVEGEGVSATAAQELFRDAPPGRAPDGKFIYGIFKRPGDLIGVLEGMQHYPEENIWWIGLLMLAPETRGCGIGRKVVQRFFEYVRSQQGTAVMLGVVEENKSGYHFWQQIGFKLVRQTEPRLFGRKMQVVYVMRNEVSEN